MGHVVVEIIFYNCKVHFRRLINCCECCHTVDSTRLDINYIKCYNSAQKQKVNINDSIATRINVSLC